VKRRDLIQQLETMGCVLIRHGGKHDWYQNPRTRMAQPVPRHAELNEHLARSILKKLAD
jgi:mRNA interferase HicA